MTTDYQQLWEGVANVTDEAEAVRTLAKILDDKEGRSYISRLDGEAGRLCLEILDHGLAVLDLTPAERQAFFVTLRRLAGSLGRLPDSVKITDKIEPSAKVLSSNVFADLKDGMYNGHRVAIKVMRVAAQDNFLKIRKQFCKEVVLWNTLSHPNVMKLAGVFGDMGKGEFATVSEWMTNGNVMEFITGNSANRLELLHGAAQGLKYLHGANIVHGDLKGANILMSNDTPPRACLADFGFMTLVLDPVEPMGCSAQLEGGTMTFMSPELLLPEMFGKEVAVPTPEADIYAFGFVILQVITGEIPFRGVRQTELGMSAVQGKRPPKPEDASTIGLSDPLWDFVQRCWAGDAKSRPKVGEAVTRLGEAATGWDGVMPPHVRVDDNASDSSEELSGSVENYEFFRLSSSIAPESPTDSQVTTGLFNRLSVVLTQFSESPQEEESQEVVVEPTKEEHDIPPEGVYPHLDQHLNPPPSQLPPRKRKGLKYYISKFLEFLSVCWKDPEEKETIAHVDDRDGKGGSSVSSLYKPPL